MAVHKKTLSNFWLCCQGNQTFSNKTKQNKTRKTASWTSAAIIETLMTGTISEVIRKIPT